MLTSWSKAPTMTHYRRSILSRFAFGMSVLFSNSFNCMRLISMRLLCSSSCSEGKFCKNLLGTFSNEKNLCYVFLLPFLSFLIGATCSSFSIAFSSWFPCFEDLVYGMSGWCAGPNRGSPYLTSMSSSSFLSVIFSSITAESSISEFAVASTITICFWWLIVWVCEYLCRDFQLLM